MNNLLLEQKTKGYIFNIEYKQNNINDCIISFLAKNKYTYQNTFNGHVELLIDGSWYKLYANYHKMTNTIKVIICLDNELIYKPFEYNFTNKIKNNILNYQYLRLYGHDNDCTSLVLKGFKTIQEIFQVIEDFKKDVTLSYVKFSNIELY